MIQNLSKFFLDLDRFERGVRRGTEALAIDFGKTIRQKVAEQNKFKTGRSAASWNLNVSRILRQIADDGQRSSIAGASEEGAVNVGGFSLGKTLRVSNVIHYIQLVNTQYKPGFIQLGISNAVTEVNRRRVAVYRSAFKAT